MEGGSPIPGCQKRRADLERGLGELRLKAGREQVAQLMNYYSMVLKWNRTARLVSRNDEERFVTQHLLPCAAAVRHIPSGVREIADVGSGSGLPGIPMKILRPEVTLTLIEANTKKSLFLQEVVRTLGLSMTEVMHLRAENVEGRYAFVVTRALGQLGDALGVCMRLLAPGGTLMVFKGHRDAEEMAELGNLLTRMDAELTGRVDLVFPLTSKEGRLFFFAHVSRET